METNKNMWFSHMFHCSYGWLSGACKDLNKETVIGVCSQFWSDHILQSAGKELNKKVVICILGDS
jgi:hypothetical protein